MEFRNETSTMWMFLNLLSKELFFGMVKGKDLQLGNFDDAWKKERDFPWGSFSKKSKEDFVYQERMSHSNLNWWSFLQKRKHWWKWNFEGKENGSFHVLTCSLKYSEARKKSSEGIIFCSLSDKMFFQHSISTFWCVSHPIHELFCNILMKFQKKFFSDIFQKIGHVQEG